MTLPLRTILTGMLAVLVAAGTLRGPETPFCAFVKKVVAAAPGEFNSLKGEVDTTLSKTETRMFKGTLSPNPESLCTLHTRRATPEGPAPPLYACVLKPWRTLTEAESLYEKALTELRACFPSDTLADERSADKDGAELSNESWMLHYKHAGVQLDLTLLYAKGWFTDVALNVTDTAPPR